MIHFIKKHFQKAILPFGYCLILFLVHEGNEWISLSSGIERLGLFLLLFFTILAASFSIVKEADFLAEKLGEPYGTLILTLAVTGIEIMMISAVMVTDTTPTLARDTMYSVVMILLGGVLGYCLLIGGIRFHEPHFNLKGGKAFLSLIIPLAVLSLIMPNFTTGGYGYFSNLHAMSIVLLSTLIYAIFLAVQTHWHREFFLESSLISLHPEVSDKKREPLFLLKKERRKIFVSTLLLLVFIPIVILLSKKLALLLTFKTVKMESFLTDSTRTALGGFIVALLILAPEALAAIVAARKNQMQRSVNILLGSVLATIGLTVPAALGISLYIGHPIHLGLDAADMTLLVMTLATCMMTFSQRETNAFQGFIHLLLFAIYILFLFD